MMLNMKTGRRSYDPDFKKAIVDKVLQDGFSATAVANEHELNPGTVQRWVALARAGKPLCAQEAKREEALRQKQLSDAEKARNYDNVVSERDQAIHMLEKMREENEFLKKATAFFAKEMQDTPTFRWK